MPASKISWTDHAINFLTWNCNKVSPGCKNCYAAAHSKQYPKNSAGGEFNGAPTLREKAFEELRLTPKGSTVFINTHSDTFHEQNPLGWIRRMFMHMNQRPDLIFLVLTKRPQVAYELRSHLNWTGNIWLGTSIESDAYLSRSDWLYKVPVIHRFLSIEPLLEMPADPRWKIVIAPPLGWVIVGGESGEMRRSFRKEWAAAIRDLAVAQRIPFYFKQGGDLFPDSDRLLDGRTWDERPAAFEALRQQYAITQTQGTLF